METLERAERIERVRESAIKTIKLLVEASQTAYEIRSLALTMDDKRKFLGVELDCMNRAYDIKDELSWILTEEDLKGIEM